MLINKQLMVGPEKENVAQGKATKRGKHTVCIESRNAQVLSRSSNQQLYDPVRESVAECFGERFKSQFLPLSMEVLSQIT